MTALGCGHDTWAEALGAHACQGKCLRTAEPDVLSASAVVPRPAGAPAAGSGIATSVPRGEIDTLA